jgi:N-acetylmuramoyl-L-alanine amidase
LIGGVAVTESDALLMDVLADLSMTATLDTSLKIGGLVLEQLSTVARLHKRQVEQAAFTVLKSADVPSILVETGFISNPKEAERLSSPAYQEKVARAIRRGIQSWFARQPPPGTLLAWQRERGGREVTISSGDTLSEIAERFGVSVASIKENNGLRQDVIYIGQTLIIPEGSR